MELEEMIDADFQNRKVIIEVSNHHVHVSEEHLEILFGFGYKLQRDENLKDNGWLSQKGQFAAKEKVTLINRQNEELYMLKNLRILGPIRKNTQVELSETDARRILKLKNVPYRISGNTENTPSIIVMGPKGSVELKSGVIIAKRHIHVPQSYAEQHNIQDGVDHYIFLPGNKETIYGGVTARVGSDDKTRLRVHLDTDEGNASASNGDTYGFLLKNRDEISKIPSKYWK